MASRHYSSVLSLTPDLHTTPPSPSPPLGERMTPPPRRSQSQCFIVTGAGLRSPHTTTGRPAFKQDAPPLPSPPAAPPPPPPPATGRRQRLARETAADWETASGDNRPEAHPTAVCRRTRRLQRRVAIPGPGQSRT